MYVCMPVLVYVWLSASVSAHLSATVYDQKKRKHTTTGAYTTTHPPHPTHPPPPPTTTKHHHLPSCMHVCLYGSMPVCLRVSLLLPVLGGFGRSLCMFLCLPVPGIGLASLHVCMCIDVSACVCIWISVCIAVCMPP